MASSAERLTKLTFRRAPAAPRPAAAPASAPRITRSTCASGTKAHHLIGSELDDRGAGAALSCFQPCRPRPWSKCRFPRYPAKGAVMRRRVFLPRKRRVTAALGPSGMPERACGHGRLGSDWISPQAPARTISGRATPAGTLGVSETESALAQAARPAWRRLERRPTWARARDEAHGPSASGRRARAVYSVASASSSALKPRNPASISATNSGPGFDEGTGADRIGDDAPRGFRPPARHLAAALRPAPRSCNADSVNPTGLGSAGDDMKPQRSRGASVTVDPSAVAFGHAEFRSVPGPEPPGETPTRRSRFEEH